MKLLRFYLLALLSALGLLTSGPASALITLKYYFVGPCVGNCSGLLGPIVGSGVGVLTLQNYTPGDPLAADNFVDFVYYPTGFEIETFSFYSISGSLPGGVPSPATFEIEGNGAPHGTLSFSSSSRGAWCAGYVSSKCGFGFGSSSSWALVPEPSTWAMMLVGFAGLGFAGYRAKRRLATISFPA
jgi:hypothetical protein